MMIPLPALDRRNLSVGLSDLLREMIFDGRLEAGSRINEVHLSQRLSVSRTPLREALAVLVAEGAIESVARRGFFVRSLTAEEARNVYPIRAFLDPEALRLSGVPTPQRFKALEDINRRLRGSKTVKSAIQLDDEWHLALYADCPNAELLDLIKLYMRRTRRYEFASMREKRILAHSSKSKAEIVKLLREKKLAAACKRLRQSLGTGVIPVLEWLESRNT